MLKALVYLSLPQALRGHPDVAQIGPFARPGDVPMLPYLREHFPAAAEGRVRLVIAEDDETAAREIGDAEVFFGWLTPALLQRAERLRWVQSTNASQEQHLFAEFARSDVALTSVAGIYNDAIADHVYALLLGLTRLIPRFVRDQQQRRWQPHFGRQTTYLAGKTMGVVGLGGIGGEVARRAHAFGMRVVATRAHPDHPRPEYMEHVWGPDGLNHLLRVSDVIAVCAPETPGTRKMIGRDELALAKPGAYIINIGRGALIDLDALVAALREGGLAGAGLDVLEIEPLPADHLLWEFDNVIITPHMAGGPSTWGGRRVDVFLDNLLRYLDGRELRNVVDKSEWRAQ